MAYVTRSQEIEMLTNILVNKRKSLNVEVSRINRAGSLYFAFSQFLFKSQILLLYRVVFAPPQKRYRQWCHRWRQALTERSRRLRQLTISKIPN
jgi:hypothetical protein